MSKTIKICPDGNDMRTGARSRRAKSVAHATAVEPRSDTRRIVDSVLNSTNADRRSFATPCDRAATQPTMRSDDSFDEAAGTISVAADLPTSLTGSVFAGRGPFQKPEIDPDQPPQVSPPDRRTAIDDVIDAVALAAVDEILLAMQGKGDRDIMAALDAYRELGEIAFSANPFIKDPRASVEEVMHELGAVMVRNFRGRNTRCELGSDDYLRYASWAAIGELALASTAHSLNEPDLWPERLAFDELSLYLCTGQEFSLFPCAEPVISLTDQSFYTCRLFADSVKCVTETPDDGIGTTLGTDDFELRGRATSTVVNSVGGERTTTTIEATTYEGQYDTGTCKTINHVLFEFPLNGTPGARTTFEGVVTPFEADLTSAQTANGIGQVVDVVISLGVSAALARFGGQVAVSAPPQEFGTALQMLIDSGLISQNAIRQLDGLGGLLARGLAPETLLGYRVRGVFLNAADGGNTAPPNWFLNLEFRIFNPVVPNTLGAKQTRESETALEALRPPQYIYKNQPVVLQQFNATRTATGETLTQLPGQYQVRHRTLLIRNPEVV